MSSQGEQKASHVSAALKETVARRLVNLAVILRGQKPCLVHQTRAQPSRLLNKHLS